MAGRVRFRLHVAKPIGEGWRTYRWRVGLSGHDGSYRVRELPEGSDYAKAAKLRDDEMATGRYYRAWLETFR